MQGQPSFVRENVPLAPLTTFGIGGAARFFATVQTEPQLLEAVRFARARNLPLFLLGGGSNLLVHDAGFPGLVVQVGLAGPIDTSYPGKFVQMEVPAGLPWETLVDVVGAQGLSGIECLAGIPGLTGGTPVQNVGAYGQEVADTIHSVRALDLLSNTYVEIAKEQCRFAYRRSLFNSAERGRYVVTSVTFRFDPTARPKLTYADLAQRFVGEAPTPVEVSRVVREIRRGKGMLLVKDDPDCRSAGSFFKNPIVPASVLDQMARTLMTSRDRVPHWSAGENRVKVSAAWLLEQAGFGKGYVLGCAGISSRHSLALINRGGASCDEICALRDRIRDEVRRAFGIPLEQEPVEVGPGTDALAVARRESDLKVAQ